MFTPKPLGEGSLPDQSLKMQELQSVTLLLALGLYKSREDTYLSCCVLDINTGTDDGRIIATTQRPR